MGQPVLTFLQKLAREIPEAPECRLALALHLVILGRIEEAIAIDAALPSDLPLATAYRIEFARAYFNRGDKHFQQNDFEKALPDLDRAIQYDPQYSEAYDHRGYVYLQRRDFDRAIADYDRAIRFGPAYPGLSYPNRAAAYLGKGDFDKANADLAKVIEIAPDDATFWYFHALTRLAAGRLDEYRKDCAEMLQRFAQTDSADNAQWVAWSCALASAAVGDYTKPIGLAEKAVKSDPKSVQYLTTLGAVLDRAGRFEEAVLRLAEADRLVKEPSEGQPTSPAYAWFFLAVAHQRLGHSEEAKKWLDKGVACADKTLHDEKQSDPAVPWNRRLTLKLFRAEAEALLKPAPPPQPPTPAEKGKQKLK